MLQVSTIEKEFDRCLEGLKKRGLKDAEQLLKDVLERDQSRKSIQQELDEILHRSNNLAKEIGTLFKEGKREEGDALKAETSELKQRSKELSGNLNQVEEEITNLLYNIPNVPNKIVPAGNSDEDNEVIKTVDDSTPDLGENKKPHWDLIEEYGIVDFELGNKVTGAGFPFYRGKGAKLVRGMINYFLDKAEEAGYIETQPPTVVNEASGYGTGQLPDKEGQMYYIGDSDLYLIPTAEVPITNMYRGDIIEDRKLPIKHSGYTPCFRREAGSWGSHVRGLNPPASI